MSHINYRYIYLRSINEKNKLLWYCETTRKALLYIGVSHALLPPSPPCRQCKNCQEWFWSNFSNFSILGRLHLHENLKNMFYWWLMASSQVLLISWALWMYPKLNRFPVGNVSNFQHEPITRYMIMYRKQHYFFGGKNILLKNIY